MPRRRMAQKIREDVQEKIDAKTPEAPPPARWVWFEDSKDYRRRMAGDSPARRKDGTLLPINQVQEFEDIEIYSGDCWIEGMRVPDPKPVKLTVTFNTFDDLDMASRKAINALPFLDLKVLNIEEDKGS